MEILLAAGAVSSIIVAGWLLMCILLDEARKWRERRRWQDV